MADSSKAGSFVEIKKSQVGEGSKVPHLSYIGDATIGRAVNVGAGSITCNYDGFSKYPTEVGDEAFIGSDTMLVAPVRVGRGAITGAGSVITQDVPDGSLGIGRSRQEVFDDWASRWRGQRLDDETPDATDEDEGERE
jgi:bifunctional UDP-N-acetylglucosamine pyrophosphorylase/glucosamine-1-phosphate N-acetyltransferase